MEKSKFLIFFSITLLLITGNLYAAEFVAFSLKVAQDRIQKIPEGKDYRKNHPEVFTMAGITKIKGLVYDRKNEDIILIGERKPERAILTIDDLAVALRARFVYGEWPMVSIDPIESPIKTGMQLVRFEGGIEDTQFGQDLFDADYRLKKISFGLLSPGIPEFKSEWELIKEWRRKTLNNRFDSITIRYWFYPILQDITVREDVVGLDDLKVGVFAEVLSAEKEGKKIEDLSNIENKPTKEFVKAVSANFDNIAKVHPSFLRLKGLEELVALTRALESMDDKPNFSWWLNNYKINKIETKRELKELTISEEFTIETAEGITHVSYEIVGGVELMAIALRLKKGDIRALKEAVLKTRPNQNYLMWSFIVEDWIIPASSFSYAMDKNDDIQSLLAHASFIQRHGRYDEAINIYNKLIEFKSPWKDIIYCYKGMAYFFKESYNDAILNFSKAIELYSEDADFYNYRGSTYFFDKKYDLAISDYTKAIEINPKFAAAYNNRGEAYTKKGQYLLAISDLNKAIEINPMEAFFIANRGVVYFKKEQYQKAILDYTKAIELDSWFGRAYDLRAEAFLIGLKNRRKACSDLIRACELGVCNNYTIYLLARQKDICE